MKKVVIAFLLITSFYSSDLIAQFSGGSGTAQDPYQISTTEQLQQIKDYPDAHFIQTKNIDASQTKNWNDGKGFQPLGTNLNSFSGNYNGNGFSICGLYINRETEKYAGLFGYTNRAVIENVRLENASVSGFSNTGILMGFSINSRVIDTHIHGSVSGSTHIGGITGFNYGKITKSSADVKVEGYTNVGGLVGFNRGAIEESFAKGEISGTGNSIGGLIGNNYDGTVLKSYANASVSGLNATSFGGLIGSNGGEISKSHAHGSVTGRSYVGGLIGFNRGDIEQSYSTADVTGSRNGVGGLVGNNFGGKIVNSFAKGAVDGAIQVGGLIGVNRSKGVVKESYATGSVSGDRDVGGFIGINNNVVQCGFWNKQTSGQNKGIGNGSSKDISGLSTEEMTGSKNEQNMPCFAFNSIWGSVDDDYPQLLWKVPFFVIEHITTDNSIDTGQLLTLTVSVKNVGGKADTNSVTFKNKKGEIIASAKNVILQSNETRNLVFEWQTTTSDKGKFDFSLETPFDRQPVSVNVIYLPDKVEVNEPGNLAEHVNLRPVFKWEDTFLAESYELQIAEDGKFESIILNADNIDTLFYKLPKSLDYLNSYFWRVRAKNTEETGAWSSVQSFTTIIEKPEKVRLVEPVDEIRITSTLPDLTWMRSVRADEYHLQLSKEDEFEETVFDTTFASPDTTFTFEYGLETDTEFFWRMKASNAGGDSPWSEVHSFLTSENASTEDKYVPMEYSLKQNYPNPFNLSTTIQYGIPEPSEVYLEVLNMLGQTVAVLVDEKQSPGWHSAVFDASGLSSGFYLYRLKTQNYEQTKKLMLIK